MKEHTKEFLQKLAALMEEYEVDFEITESCHGYNGFEVDGLEIGVKIHDIDDNYHYTEYVDLSGRYHDAKDILELIEEDAK
jgi:hypothetical protein